MKNRGILKMQWNDGKERALFEKEQAKLCKEYLAAGMTGEQIQVLRNYDENWYRSRRRETRHTQRLNITAFDEESCDSEAKNPLLKKFIHRFSTEDKHWRNDRFDWIEQLADKSLYKAVKSLTERDKEILSLLIIDGFNLTQVAKQLKVSHQAISKKTKKFQNIFGERLRK